jgi:Carbohydrate family 9 binding domain-like
MNGLRESSPRCRTGKKGSDVGDDSAEPFILLNQLGDEFANRYRRGERPALQEYIDRHPELADEIREFFPVMADSQRLVNDEPIQARPQTSWERYRRWARRNPVIAVLSGVLTCVMVLATVLSLIAAGHFNRLRLGPDRVAGRERVTRHEAEIRIGDALPPAVRARPPDVYIPPQAYVAYRASEPLSIDGQLDEPAWHAVPWTDDFVDIEGDRRPPPRFRTRVKMLWDDRFFYIGAELQEPHVQATYTRHDSFIFHEDNDFEVFLNPDGNNHNYAELEMNALNTTWDLRLRKAYRDEGQAENDWEIPGLKTAVHVQGTANNPGDVDQGWTIEIAIPWELVTALNDRNSSRGMPRDGDQWRVNFSRVEWRFDIENGKYVRQKGRPEDNWVWSPQGAVNMHQPETWGYVQFSSAAPGQATSRPDPAGPAKHLLHQIYRAERSYHKEHGSYAPNLNDLGLGGIGHESLAGPPRIVAAADGFQASVDVRLPDDKQQTWCIREDSLVWSTR